MSHPLKAFVFFKANSDPEIYVINMASLVMSPCLIFILLREIVNPSIHTVIKY